MNAAYRNVLAAAVALMPLAASAAEFNDVEAKKIEVAISSSLPKVLGEAGVVGVKPATNRFDVTLDLQSVLAKAVAPWTVTNMTPIVHALTPGEGALWNFSSNGSIQIATELPAASRTNAFELTIGELADKGRFDTGLGYLRDGEISLKDIKTTMRSSQETIKIALKDFSTKVQSTDVKAGVIDVVSNHVGHDMVQTFGAFPNPEVKISAGSLSGQMNATGLDVAGISRLTAFWRAPGRAQDLKSLKPEEIKELSAIVATHKPFAQSFGGDTTVSDVSIGSAGKTFSIGKLAYNWGLEGIADNGAVVFGAKISDLSVSTGFWPAGLEKALPTEMAVHGRYFGFKLGPVWEALAEPDLAKRPEISKIIYPDGRLTLQLSDSHLRSPFYDISVEGTVLVAPGGQDTRPAADLTIKAKDFDKTVKFLQDTSKSVPVMGRAAMFALMAKGLGKPEADGSMVWSVKFDPVGKATVNGQALPF